jgi:uncharacterized protein YebE (UPF0316 family)
MDLQVLAAVGLAGVSTVSVALWTLRVALAARGRRIAASGTASVEALLFAGAFSRVVDALDDPLRIVGYAVGVAAGTFVGLTLEARSERRRTAPESSSRTVRRAGRPMRGSAARARISATSTS